MKSWCPILLAVVFLAPAPARAARERLPLNDGWRSQKDDPPGNTVDLRYDVRPEVGRRRDDGPPTNLEPFSSPSRQAFSGLCLVIVRAKPGQPGVIRVTATGDGLRTGTTVITTTDTPAHRSAQP